MIPFGYVPRPEGYDDWDKATKAAWGALCSFARWDKELRRGECWPSQEKLCIRASYTLNALKVAIKTLEGWGLIQRRRKGNGLTVYTLTPYVSRGHISTSDISASDISASDISASDTLMYQPLTPMYQPLTHHVSMADTHVSVIDTEQYQEQYQEQEEGTGGPLPAPPPNCLPSPQASEDTPSPLTGDILPSAPVLEEVPSSTLAPLPVQPSAPGLPSGPSSPASVLAIPSEAGYISATGSNPERGSGATVQTISLEQSDEADPEGGRGPGDNDPADPAKIDNLFAGLYRAYPRKGGRDKALETFRKLFPKGITRAEARGRFFEIKNRLDAATPSWGDRETGAPDPRYMPVFDNWLRGECVDLF